MNKQIHEQLIKNFLTSGQVQVDKLNYVELAN